MKEQNFSNHSRIVPGYHIVGGLIIMFIFAASVLKLNRNYNSHIGGLLIPSLFILIAIALLVIFWYARVFALKAQDRAIRAEENLRYFAITGKLLDSKLTMAQIIALRFAPNNELVDLAHRAVHEDMTPKQIKMAITHWKADYNRV
jgi:L-cystine uptake protein TcyP (sodium:dicarboxylate symporter family)